VQFIDSSITHVNHVSSESVGPKKFRLGLSEVIGMPSIRFRLSDPTGSVQNSMGLCRILSNSDEIRPQDCLSWIFNIFRDKPVRVSSKTLLDLKVQVFLTFYIDRITLVTTKKISTEPCVIRQSVINSSLQNVNLVG